MVQHSDPDVLALIALGEPAAPTDAEHLRTCRECRDEVASFARVVHTVRVDVPGATIGRAPGDVSRDLSRDLSSDLSSDLSDDAVPSIPPPPRVWDAIAAATGVSAVPRTEQGAAAEPPAAASRTLGLVPREDLPPVAHPGDARAAAGRVQRGGAAQQRSRLLLAVAASLVVGAAAGATGATLLDREPQQQVLAQVDLDNLKKTSATGRAVVLQTATGPRIRVDTSALAPTPDGFYEVWLIDRDIKKMVGIGILHPGEDEFVVPNGVDLAQYPIVDISVQQPGDPKHSGNSVLRGTISG